MLIVPPVKAALSLILSTSNCPALRPPISITLSATGKGAVDGERTKRVARSYNRLAPDGHIGGDRAGAAEGPTINDDR